MPYGLKANLKARRVVDTDPWDFDPDEQQWGESPDDTTYAQGRLTERTYASKSFVIDRETSRDFGQPARFIHKVFDTDAESVATFEGSEWLISQTPKGRYQFKLLVAREAGKVKELWIQRVPPPGSSGNQGLAESQKRECHASCRVVTELGLHSDKE